MDFLDPKKTRRHAILLYTGYIFIGIAIVISTIVLVYQANGFGVNSQGEVVQNGLVFMSTQPSSARIYLNGKLNDARTNSRLSLAAGTYNVRLSLDGYRDWTRNISVLGGDVQNYDYPFLFPKNLQSSAEATYQAAPGIASQSRDRRWLLVQQNPTATVFDIYDLKAKQLVAQSITLPAGVLTAADGAQAWEAVQWSNDNRHALLKHTYGSGYEYILIDREDPSQSRNLNKTFSTNPASMTLIDNKPDDYHLLASDGTLSRATLGNSQLTPLLKGVISYKSFGSKQILYATSQGAAAGKVNIMLFDGDKSYLVREVAAGGSYLLDVADYRGARYVVLAASNESTAYVYRDPIGQLSDPKVKLPTALRALRVPNPGYVSFSPSTRYIMSQNGTQFGVYDIFLKRIYVYTIKSPLDAPQTHAFWMDGDRLAYVSGGKLLVTDFDGRNRQVLMAVNASNGPFFSQDYKYVFGLTPNAGATVLNRTPLRTPADL